MTTFTQAEKLADTVLYEGYLLYPYRKSSLKNQFRWQFGVLMPSSYSATAEPSWLQSETLLVGANSLRGRLRFLRVRGDEGQEESLDFSGLDRRLEFPGGFLEIEYLEPVLRLTVRNLAGGCYGTREEAIEEALVGVHLLLGVDQGRFHSLADPPEQLREAAGRCCNLHTWPVLLSERLVLCSPIILPDRPELAPESPGDFYDATEIDELLTLRVMTLTDAEKAEAAADPRARAIIERADEMPREHFEKLHGRLSVGGKRLARGSRVRLHPKRNADAQDMFLIGKIGIVGDVHYDLDGGVHLSVVLEDDPMLESYRRSYYFQLEEVEPL